ncbi:arginase [Bacteriovorax stolpii]|uniref:agmatinase family protein n=1 Tax=Bacteriovorax stolpii TaxID=960 RepID=UPI00115BADBA|nr:agmatinase family protein [Bacteriovorax stolpii]QDK40814.1 arginase [Bacteriovorax stolpii]
MTKKVTAKKKITPKAKAKTKAKPVAEGRTVIDPNAKASSKDGIYGLPFKEHEAKVVYLPIPWDVTTSYQAGTSKGPEAILMASEQIDFFDLDYIDAYQAGLFMKKESAKIKKLNREGRALAKKIIDADDAAMAKNKTLQAALKKVNSLCNDLNNEVYKETKALLDNDQISVVVGGDHATPFGAIKAYAEKYEGLGVLHFDAHSDTRDAYMGFENSHASIMHNVMEKIPQVGKLVQVGIRDFCQQEYEYTQANPKVEVYFDQNLTRRKLAGESFEKIAREIVSHLPKNVYISFDIDGLDPRYCPHTGTPVPGGLDYSEVVFIINELIRSKRTLVGFDLVEVAPSPKDKADEWDANVGMRLLYKMTSAALASQGLIKLR